MTANAPLNRNFQHRVTISNSMRRERAETLEELKRVVNRAIVCVPRNDLQEIMIDHMNRINGRKDG